MNLSKAVIPSLRLSKSMLAPGSMRLYSSKPQGQIPIGYTKIKEKYKHFQEDNGIPIHLKGGPLDRFFYYTTLIGCAVGMVMCGEYYYSAAFPKKA